MAEIIADRVLETTTTLGTGAILLNGALAQYRSFGSAIGAGNTCPYCIVSGDTVSWETGVGTISAQAGGGYVLTRTTVTASSNGGNAISLVGTSTVSNDITASYFPVAVQAVAPSLVVPAAAPTAYITPVARTIAARAGAVLDVQDYGIVPDVAGDQGAALQAFINGFPTGTPIHIFFSRDPANIGQTLYTMTTVARSNGRVVRCTFDDSCDIVSYGGYIAFDRVEVWRGGQRFETTQNPYFGASGGLTIGYGEETRLWNVSTGPNTVHSDTVVFDTRFAATGLTPGASGGGQLALVEQHVSTFENLLDGTSPSHAWHITIGPQYSELGAATHNQVSSILYHEADVVANGPVAAITDQAQFQTNGGGFLMAAGGGQAAQPWGSFVAGDMSYGFRVVGAASQPNTTLPPTQSARWPFYPVAFGSNNPASVSTSNSIVITDASGANHTVVLNGGGGTGSLADVAASINAAGIPNIQAQVQPLGASTTLSRLAIYSTVPRDAGTFTLANGSGTPLATLGLTAGAYSIASQVGSYAVCYSQLLSLTGSIVAPNSAMIICGTSVTLNGGFGTGSLTDIAASINAANIVGVTAEVSSWSSTARLAILCYMPQQPGGLVLANSTNSPLGTMHMPATTIFPPTPPHAWAQASSEVVGSGAVFASGDAIVIGYSLPTSNTTSAGSTSVTVGAGSLGVADAAAAINLATVSAGWTYATTTVGSVSQGAQQLTLASVTGLTIGMPIYDPAHPSGAYPSIVQPYTTILDINPATNQISLSGVQLAVASGTSLVFGKVYATVQNPSSTGAALLIRNMTGGSLWITDGTTTPCSKIGMIPGQHWPGSMPPGLQSGFEVSYGAIAAGGSGVKLGGAMAGYLTDPVQWPDSPIRTRWNWRHGIRTDEASFNDGIALRMAPGQSIAWGTPQTGQYALSTSAGTLVWANAVQSGGLQVLGPNASGGNTALIGVTAPSTPPNTPIFNEHSSITGTGTGVPTFHGWSIDSDNAALPAYASGYSFSHYFGGAAMTGQRQAVNIVATLTATSGNTTQGFYGALAASFGTSVPDGTGGLSGNNALALSAKLKTGATGWGGVQGAEIDIAMQTGTSSNYKGALNIVLQNDDAVHATIGESALTFSAAPLANYTPIGWNMLFSVGWFQGWWPMAATGTIMGTNTPENVGSGSNPTGPSYACAYGIDFSQITFSGASFRSPNFAVDGSGNLTARSLTVSNGGTLSGTVALPGSLALTGAVSTSGTLTNTGTITGGTMSPATAIIGTSTVDVAITNTIDSNGNPLITWTAGGSTASQISHRIKVKQGYVQFQDTNLTAPNAAGADAVDLQLGRGAASQVASGNYAVAVGGLNTASGVRATAIGYSNTASGQGSVALGQAANAPLAGSVAFSGGYLGQALIAQLGGVSGSGTPVRLTSDGSAAGATNTLNLASNYVFGGQLTVSARNVSDGTSALWIIPLVAENPAGTIAVRNPGTAAISPSVVSSSLTGSTITITADTTNAGVNITFTPPASTTAHVSAVFVGATEA